MSGFNVFRALLDIAPNGPVLEPNSALNSTAYIIGGIVIALCVIGVILLAKTGKKK